MTITENRHARAHVDGILIALVIAMSLFGIVAVCVATYSPQSSSDASFLNHIVESSYAMRQCLFVLLAPLILGVIMAFPYDILRRRAEWFYWAAFILLAVTTIFNRAQGVKAWLDMLWGYTIQPSEFMKLAMILVLAKNFARQDSPMSDMKSFIHIFMIVIIPSVVILLQGETGSLLVIIFMFAVMMYFANVSLKTLAILAALAIAAVFALYAFMRLTGSNDYRMARIYGWLDPDAFSSSDAYQQTMSKMTIGSGGLTGNGMFVAGSIAQLNYVPADWTDFIYAAWFTRDKFGRMIIIGVTGMLLFHVLENIAMTLGLMPITGILLPFLSYGGSNMMTNMGGVGLVLNATRNRSLNVSVSTPQTFYNPYRIHKRFKTRSY